MKFHIQANCRYVIIEETLKVLSKEDILTCLICLINVYQQYCLSIHYYNYIRLISVYQ